MRYLLYSAKRRGYCPKKISSRNTGYLKELLQNSSILIEYIRFNEIISVRILTALILM